MTYNHASTVSSVPVPVPVGVVVSTANSDSWASTGGPSGTVGRRVTRTRILRAGISSVPSQRSSARTSSSGTS